MNSMQIGMIGLGRMGENMVRRMAKDGHQCVVYDNEPAALNRLKIPNVTTCQSLTDFIAQLVQPRVVWLMIPADFVETNVHILATMLSAEDILIDGGNSHYQDDIMRIQGAKASELIEAARAEAKLAQVV